MKVTRSKVISIAKDELGYCGKKYSTDNVEIKEALNGLGKFNKYSRKLYEVGKAINGVGYYNTPKDGADWCCIFPDWLFLVAAGYDAQEAIKHKPLSGGFGGCGAGVSWAWKAYPESRRGTVPHIGDQIFYKELDSKGAECWAHTGLVIDLVGDVIVTVEGNWGCKVVRREVKIGQMYSGQWIGGFASPYYDEEEEPLPTEETVTIAKTEYDALLSTADVLTAENENLRTEVENLRQALQTSEAGMEAVREATAVFLSLLNK